MATASAMARGAVRRPPSLLGVAGTVAVLGGAVMIGLLSTTSADLNPLSQPLSMYALTTAAWLFNSGVTAVAVGVGILLVALVRTGRVTRLSVESCALLVCAVGLMTLIVFPDRNTDGALTTAGWIHWTASMAAFAALPVAPVLLGRRHRSAAGCSVLPGIARALAWVAIALVTVFVAGSIIKAVTPIPLWHIGGAVERALAAVELAAAVLVGLWTCRGCPLGSHAAPISEAPAGPVDPIPARAPTARSVPGGGRRAAAITRPPAPCGARTVPAAGSGWAGALPGRRRTGRPMARPTPSPGMGRAARPGVTRPPMPWPGPTLRWHPQPRGGH